VTTASALALVHAAGFITAAAMYALLLLLALQGRHQPLRDGGLGARLALATGGLGLVWNAGALGALLGVGHSVLGSLLTWAPAMAAFGFLPAVFVHAALAHDARAFGHGAARLVRALAYALASIAGFWHVGLAWQGASVPGIAPLSLLAYGYLALVPALVWLTPGGSRLRHGLVSGGALALFAVSALHLSQHTPDVEPLAAALVGHHASLPLALAILYLDYRFLLADVFLKRALALVLLAALVSGGLLLAWPALHDTGAGAGSPSPTALVWLLGVWATTVLSYTPLRRASTWLMERWLLGRPDYRRLLEDLQGELERCATVPAVLAALAERLASALSARRAGWEPQAQVAAPSGWPSLARASDGERGRRAELWLPTAEAPAYLLCLDDLAGGRRLLSDDCTLLERAALLGARRVDALRLLHERCESSLRQQEIAKLAAEAELRALRAQLNPHFLFNALNTIGYLLNASPERARRTLFQLTHLLRAVLRRSGGEVTTLGQELDLVESYLAIERARFEERLRTVLTVPRGLRRLRVPPLVLQPLVENAIKHGISPCRNGGELRLSAHIEGSGAQAMLVLRVEDTGAGSDGGPAATSGTGMGLASVRKRLHASYGARAELRFESRFGAGTRVTLRLPAASAALHAPGAAHAADAGALAP
jgi:signal transduction histidine kinase